MLFVQRPSFIPQGSFGRRPMSFHQGDDSQSFEESYYRRLAEEHQRRAQAAMALARQEHQRVEAQREAEAMRLARLRRQAVRPRPHSIQAGYFGGLPFEIGRVQEAHDYPQGIEFHHGPRHLSPANYQRRQGHRASFHEHRDVPDVFFDFVNGTQEPESTHKKQVRFAAESVPTARKAKGKAKAMDEDPKSAAPSNISGDFFSEFLKSLTGGLSEEEQIEGLRNIGVFGSQRPARPTFNPSAGPSGSRRPAAVPVHASASHPTSTSPSAKTTPSSPSRHSQSFSSIDTIQLELDHLKAGFQDPEHLDFDNETAKLLYTATNAPFHQYEGGLIKLLTKLDAVESDGAESIRGARKALVKAVETELDRLDVLKEDALKKAATAVTSEATDSQGPIAAQGTAAFTSNDEHETSATEDASGDQEVEGYIVTTPAHREGTSTELEIEVSTVVSPATVPLPLDEHDMALDSVQDTVATEPSTAMPTSEPSSNFVDETATSATTRAAESSMALLEPQADVESPIKTMPLASDEAFAVVDADAEAEDEASFEPQHVEESSDFANDDLVEAVVSVSPKLSQHEEDSDFEML